ncbi:MULTISPECIES: hybrid sensor histidine kinase/response regulator [unclassified Lentimicrobium]|uniref:hybrid sensor histidine kinase/response regulator n=1 Tax=unclassified Lentimicrobium TaxID=2677434 RepID=UPI00155771AD|nr:MULTISPECIES: ATP-binding protein [unclassified Lentimicrobium]NPD47211.1 response regulator [Lentimicrobium sp. S6]NPD84866.1 response regulator [Lentimicrobium sp. L6]
MAEFTSTHLPADLDFYQKIFEKLNDIIFLVDSSGRLLETNYRKEQLYNVQTIFQDKDWKNIQRIIHSELKESDPSIELEMELLMEDKRVWYRCRVGCIEKCEDNNALYLIALNSIQKQKTREEELINAKEKAESQEKLKTSFLANMSHEIRTPMNSILGFSDLIQRSEDRTERRQYLDIIKSSGRYLLNIINDVIDISKIESGLIDIKVHRVDINEMISELADIYRSDPRLQTKDVEIIPIMPLKNADALILTDKTRLRQILSNLIDNAVKFTHKGHIEIGYQLLEKQKQDRTPHIQFFVKDSGLGVPKSDQALIFDRFHQVREGDQAIGSGLGLAIVKALVTKLGGKLSLVSENGKGSQFSFLIPYLQRSKESDKEVDSSSNVEVPDLKGRHILIAEDVDANYKFVSAVLRKTYVKLTWVKNGKDAVEAVIENDKFDLILMDLRMPIMDGYKASEHIKIIQPKIPIVALTAFAVEGDMEKALEAGCDDYLTKPINIPDFFGKLNFYLTM